MCGLVGVIGNIFTMDRKAFRNLLVFDTVRGDHSTGVATINMSDQFQLFKEVGHPFRLFDKFPEKFEPNGNIKDGLDKILMGHNRYGTMGKIIADNAHPFHHDHIIGAHNGTLDKAWLSNLDDHDKFEVDSEALIYNISKHGPEIIKKVSGAYALTWFDAKQSKVFFIRNHKRFLWYTRSKDKDTFYWASESWMLSAALSKAGVSHETPQEFEVDHLYSIDISSGSTKFREATLEKGEKIEGFTPPVQVRMIGTGNGGKSNTHNMGGTNYHNPFKAIRDSLPLPGGHGVVVPIANFQQSSKTNSPNVTKNYAKKLEKYVGRSISFWCDMERKGINGLVYLSCTPVNTEDDFEIRLYTHGKAVHKEYYNSRAALVGTVKKVVYNNISGKPEVYLLMDYRSITIPKPAVVVPLSRSGSKRGDFRGYLGVPLTEEEWIVATHQGCAYCDQLVEEKEAPDLHWFGKTDFLCPQCAEDPERKAFANSISAYS